MKPVVIILRRATLVRALENGQSGDEQQATEDFSRAASYFDDAMKFVTSRRPNLRVPQSLPQACGDKR